MTTKECRVSLNSRCVNLREIQISNCSLFVFSAFYGCGCLLPRYERQQRYSHREQLSSASALICFCVSCRGSSRQYFGKSSAPHSWDSDFHGAVSAPVSHRICGSCAHPVARISNWNAFVFLQKRALLEAEKREDPLVSVSLSFERFEVGGLGQGEAGRQSCAGAELRGQVTGGRRYFLQRHCG